jgi:hypothetical protein
MTSTSLGTPQSSPANLRVLLDPVLLDPTGHTSIDWYRPSLDGSLIVVGLGDNDPRVNPAQSRKFTARLQAANASEHPVLLKTFANAGHGASSSTDLQQEVADIYAFLFRELGVTFTPAP